MNKRDIAPSPDQIEQFQQKILTFFKEQGRSFPWRETANPYEILVSEIMLQQTQTERVVPKYLHFLQLFPTVHHLAKASLADVLNAWQGLGYNRRARFLHQCAQKLVSDFEGLFPEEKKHLLALPGIGLYTAGAVMAFANNSPEVFIETNIRTVFIHEFFTEETTVHDRDIMILVEKTLLKDDPRNWYYALMDYGVFLKKTSGNASRRSKHHTKQSRFKGSLRQKRGEILALILQKGELIEAELEKDDDERTAKALEALLDEGMIVREKGRIYIP